MIVILSVYNPKPPVNLPELPELAVAIIAGALLPADVDALIAAPLPALFALKADAQCTTNSV